MSAKKNMKTIALPVEELRRRYTYDPETGEFTLKLPRRGNPINSTVVGKSATSRQKIGYDVICIKHEGVYYRLYAHRVAWAMTYGEWPLLHIDHADGVRSNNKISNLRQATNQENTRNRGRGANNTSGYKGVSFEKRCGKWSAGVKVSGVRKFLGYFQTTEEANEVRVAYDLAHFGKFANVA